jgi:hypothetical protein
MKTMVAHNIKYDVSGLSSASVFKKQINELAEAQKTNEVLQLTS